MCTKLCNRNPFSSKNFLSHIAQYIQYFLFAVLQYDRFGNVFVNSIANCWNFHKFYNWIFSFPQLHLYLDVSNISFYVHPTDICFHKCGTYKELVKINCGEAIHALTYCAFLESFDCKLCTRTVLHLRALLQYAFAKISLMKMSDCKQTLHTTHSPCLFFKCMDT